MKYAFIVNPASGKGKHDNGIISDINKLIKANSDKDIKIYLTGGERDATVLADMIASEAGDEVVIFACGGDGTVQEVANGIFGHDNAVLGVVPVGSGNDFVRQLAKDRGNAKQYTDLEKQLEGSPVPLDLIKMSWTLDGKEESRFITNGINIGFDGNTAVLAHELKKLPLVSGAGSYLMAVASNLAKKKGQNLKIKADGKDFHNGKLLLVTAANGGFCGGGVNSCPNADLSDGLLELLAIKDLPRRRFIALFPQYKKGEIFSIKGVEELASYKQAKEITIEPLAGPLMQFVGDGEIFETGSIKIEVIPNAIKALKI